MKIWFGLHWLLHQWKICSYLLIFPLLFWNHFGFCELVHSHFIAQNILIREIFRGEGVVVGVSFIFLEVLEGSIESVISNTEWWEGISWIVGPIFFNVVVLEIKEIFVSYGSFSDLPVEKSGERPNLSMIFTILHRQRGTAFNFYPILRERLKLPTVTTALNLLEKTSSKKFCF